MSLEPPWKWFHLNSNISKLTHPIYYHQVQWKRGHITRRSLASLSHNYFEILFWMYLHDLIILIGFDSIHQLQPMLLLLAYNTWNKMILCLIFTQKDSSISTKLYNFWFDFHPNIWSSTIKNCSYFVASFPHISSIAASAASLYSSAAPPGSWQP